MMDNKRFKKEIFTTPSEEYDCCSFSDCDFTKSDLSNCTFIECLFENCNLSNVKLKDTSLKDVQFSHCKMLGLHFDVCRTFLLEMKFINCQLNFSSFFQLKLKSTRFKDCSLKEVDFTQTDLSQGQFENCDLLNAIFDRTNLEKTDFRSSFNYDFDPENNLITGAKFSSPAVFGLLDKYRIVIDG